MASLSCTLRSMKHPIRISWLDEKWGDWAELSSAPEFLELINKANQKLAKGKGTGKKGSK